MCDVLIFRERAKCNINNGPSERFIIYHGNYLLKMTHSKYFINLDGICDPKRYLKA